MADYQSDDITSDRVTVPEEKNAPEPEALPNYRLETPNYADNEETVAKALSVVRGYFSDYKGQAARSKFITEMDIADEEYRAAKTRTALDSDQSKQKESTRSQVSSATFYTDIRSITAGETSVILGNETQLPVEYKPATNVVGYAEDMALATARYYNQLLTYTFDKDGIRKKLRKYLLFLNKYANLLCEMIWDYRKRTRRLRIRLAELQDDDTVIGGKNGGGNRDDILFVEREITEKDNPSFIIHDMRNSWFDASIDEIQDQSCIITRKQKQLGELWELQRNAEFKNVGKITTAQLYSDEGEETVLSDRQSNAEESGDANEPNTLYDVFEGFVRLPISDDNGKWDTEKEIPHWYKFVFCGDIEKAPVCLFLGPNPHFYGDVPFYLGHSHQDDKGAYHLGFSTLTKSLNEQERTCINQYVDNNTKRNLKPLIAERGSLSIRDKTFASAGNQVWWITPGSRDPHEMEIQDTTQQTIPMLNTLKDMRREIMGTNKPFLGEAAGGRTTAMETRIDFEQAIKPAFEDIKYKAEVLEFIAFWNKECWDQFGDPERSLFITFEDKPVEIQPAHIVGPVNICVTAVEKFQDSVVRRSEQDRFISTIYPLQAELMSRKGKIAFFSQVDRDRNMSDVDQFWDQGQDFDAERVAKSESKAILFDGVLDMPQPAENHETHNKWHKPALAAYIMLRPEEQNPNNVMRMKQHIFIHDQMNEQAKSATQAASMQPAAPASPPITEAEISGDQMAAEAGAMERPPVEQGVE